MAITESETITDHRILSICVIQTIYDAPGGLCSWIVAFPYYPHILYNKVH